MPKFRKKPVVIEAVQWDGKLDTLKMFPEKDTKPVKLRDANLYIQTPEGKMLCSIIDWIIKGVKGEFYPCKPDIFEQTYEAV